MLWNTFEADREKLEAQYRVPEYNKDTGLSFEELRDGMLALAERESDLPLFTVRAHAIRYLLENSRVGVTVCEWFADKIDNRRLTELLKRKDFIGKVREAMTDITDKYQDAVDCYAFKAAPDFGHNAPDWDTILKLGFWGLRQRALDKMAELEASGELDQEKRAFYEGIVCVYDGAFVCMRKLAAEARRRSSENEKMPIVAERLEALCTRAPETLAEAIQTIVLYYQFQQHFDCAYVRTLGTLDVNLYPFWRADLDSGRYTREQLTELIRDFIFKMGSMKIDANIPFGLCGVDEEGRGVVNELTYVIFDEYQKLDLYDPKIHIRWTKELPRDFVRMVLGCIRDGKNSIVFINSPVASAALEKIGVEHADAVNYTIVGCYETCAAGKETPSTLNGRINLAKAVEVTMLGGRDMPSGKLIGVEQSGTPATFEEFLSRMHEQIKYFVDANIEIVNRFEAGYPISHTVPFYSSTFESAMEKGKDIYAGGAKYNNSSICAFAIASAVDSLYVIKKWVYDEKRMTLADLSDILRANWQGSEMLRLEAKKLAKYGNNEDGVDLIARDLFKYCASVINGRENGRGGVYRLGTFSIDWRIGAGECMGATADGNFAGAPTSKNVSANVGCDFEGVTAHVCSAMKMDYTDMPNGTVLDIVMHSSSVSGEDGMCAFEAILNTYMNGGGFAVHFNVHSPDVLRAAQKDPDQYKTLQIRLCGWNVLFVDLSKQEQDEFIKMSESTI